MKSGFSILAFSAKFSIILSLLLMLIIFWPLLKPEIGEKALHEQWKYGVEVQRQIEMWKAENGNYPSSIAELDGKILIRSNIRYVKAKEDSLTYYLWIDLGGRDMRLIYFSGPLYPNNGWFLHKGASGSEGFSRSYP